MPKFTPSKDGQERTTIAVKIRITRSEYEDLKVYARRSKQTIRELIEHAAINGFEELMNNDVLDEEEGEMLV